MLWAYAFAGLAICFAATAISLDIYLRVLAAKRAARFEAIERIRRHTQPVYHDRRDLDELEFIRPLGAPRTAA